MPSAQALILTFIIIENVLSFPTFTQKSDEGEKGKGYEIRFEKVINQHSELL